MKGTARDSVIALRECRKCGFVACTCLVMRHAEACPWRVAILDTKPKTCAPHELIACEQCHPCNCGKPTRWPVKAKVPEETTSS